MIVGPIPVSKIKEYLRDELDLDGDEHDRALAILRLVDNSFVSMSNETGKKDPDEERTREIVKATDTSGVKRLVRGLGKKNVRREPKVK